MIPPPRALRDQLHTLVQAHGLAAAADAIQARAALCYAIVADPGAASPPGGSRFGGVPDLPAGAAWPADGPLDDPASRCFAFLGQINWADIPRPAAIPGLPAQGLLSLFVRELGAASEPVLVASIAVADPAPTLRPATAPPAERFANPDEFDWTPAAVRFVPSISLPSDDRRWLETLARLCGSDLATVIDQIIDLTEALGVQDQIGQLLGYAATGGDNTDLYRQVALTQLGQRPMIYADYWDSLAEYEAAIEECVRRGDHQIAKGYRKLKPHVRWLQDQRAAIAAEAAEWSLLLRLDSNAAMELWINDDDPLYLFMRAADSQDQRGFRLAGEVTQG